MIAVRLSPRLAAIAGVLEELGREIEALGAALCRDPQFVARHCRELQAIDLIAQQQHALAALLSSGLAEHAVARIGIDSLRQRLGEILGPPAG